MKHWNEVYGNIFAYCNCLGYYREVAKVHGQAPYVKKDSSEELIDFDVICQLQMIGEKPKIFAYITGDEQKLLRERGLVAG